LRRKGKFLFTCTCINFPTILPKLVLLPLSIWIYKIMVGSKLMNVPWMLREVYWTYWIKYVQDMGGFFLSKSKEKKRVEKLVEK